MDEPTAPLCLRAHARDIERFESVLVDTMRGIELSSIYEMLDKIAHDVCGYGETSYEQMFGNLFEEVQQSLARIQNMNADTSDVFETTGAAIQTYNKAYLECIVNFANALAQAEFFINIVEPVLWLPSTPDTCRMWMRVLSPSTSSVPEDENGPSLHGWQTNTDQLKSMCMYLSEVISPAYFMAIVMNTEITSALSTSNASNEATLNTPTAIHCLVAFANMTAQSVFQRRAASGSLDTVDDMFAGHSDNTLTAISKLRTCGRFGLAITGTDYFLLHGSLPMKKMSRLYSTKPNEACSFVLTQDLLLAMSDPQGFVGLLHLDVYAKIMQLKAAEDEGAAASNESILTALNSLVVSIDRSLWALRVNLESDDTEPYICRGCIVEWKPPVVTQTEEAAGLIHQEAIADGDVVNKEPVSGGSGDADTNSAKRVSKKRKLEFADEVDVVSFDSSAPSSSLSTLDPPKRQKISDIMDARGNHETLKNGVNSAADTFLTKFWTYYHAIETRYRDIEKLLLLENTVGWGRVDPVASACRLIQRFDTVYACHMQYISDSQSDDAIYYTKKQKLMTKSLQFPESVILDIVLKKRMSILHEPGSDVVGDVNGSAEGYVPPTPEAMILKAGVYPILLLEYAICVFLAGYDPDHPANCQVDGDGNVADVRSILPKILVTDKTRLLLHRAYAENRLAAACKHLYNRACLIFTRLSALIQPRHGLKTV